MNIFKLFQRETPSIMQSCGDVDLEVKYSVKNEVFTSTVQIPKTSFIFHKNNKRNLVINEVIDRLKSDTSLSFIKLESIKLL